YLRFEEVIYLPSQLDEIRNAARRDQVPSGSALPLIEARNAASMISFRDEHSRHLRISSGRSAVLWAIRSGLSLSSRARRAAATSYPFIIITASARRKPFIVV